MNYTNKDYYNYILKIDNLNAPLHKEYQKILNLLIKEDLNQPINNEMLKKFFRLFEIRQYQFNEEEIEYLNKLLYYDSAFRRVSQNYNGDYVIYPELRELPNTNDLLLYYSLDLKMDVKEIIKFLSPIVNEKKLKFKKSKIENYYGTPKYLILRSKAIYDAVVLLSNRDDIEDKVLVNKTLSNIIFLLNIILNIVGLENTNETYSRLNDYDFELCIDKTQYDFMRSCYVKILEQENILIDISNKVWQSYALRNNGALIHQLTEEAVESNKMKKICTSFYSNNANTITDYSNANIGYVYPMNIASAFAVCENDVGSWPVTKDDYIDRGFPDNWQLDETSLWYEYPYHSRLFPPEYIEKQILNNNCFAEIVIDNRKQNINPLYCFYTSSATIEQIKQINYLAKKQGLEVKFLETKKETITKK